MEMYKELMEYYDSQEPSVLHEEWDKHESHKYDSGVYVDELLDFWDEIYSRPGEKILKEPEKINITNFSAPNITEHFFLL